MRAEKVYYQILTRNQFRDSECEEGTGGTNGWLFSSMSYKSWGVVLWCWEEECPDITTYAAAGRADQECCGVWTVGANSPAYCRGEVVFCTHSLSLSKRWKHNSQWKAYFLNIWYIQFVTLQTAYFSRRHNCFAGDTDRYSGSKKIQWVATT